ncbi:tetratricopeptide repeat protein [Pararobbsia silviterrae]|uniref:Tetratricopeptide repeat protein n=1 Tax=Pararobbsia silviterrae TaxID=1792498 RepID=A0A494Y2K9_9BURK|nr:tetratricopeptide repeat-containing glycosyltransferase family protein [Pararobbsia silviterrae]RKP55693.1 tetratricopeptide repeat protein [Pararobbsia silviterrae]
MSSAGPTTRRIDALFQQAVALHQNGALDEAEASYRDVLALRPKHFDATQLLGTLALQSGRIEEGMTWLTRAVSIDGRHPAIQSNLAFALNALGRHAEALAHADKALALAADFADAHNNRGNALAGLNRPADALASFERAIALQPGLAQAWNNRACALRDLGHPAQAVESCDRALAIEPRYPDAWSNRANALSDLNRSLDAKASYEKALESNSGFVDGWSNLGLTLVDLGDHAGALRCYERALALAPDHASAHWNQALCLLETGQFDRGWRAYEWRWQRASLRGARRTFAAPLWLGETPVAGKTVLLHAEQGLGDTLQFCRYAARVAALGAKVVLEVPASLMRLLADLDGVDTLVEQGRPLPDFDCHCPLLSLPLALGTTLDTIPADVPYLFADPRRAAVWRERADAIARGRLRVGLVWAGGHRPHVPELRKNDARRSMSLDRLAALFDVEGVQFFSLQIGAAATQRDALRDVDRLADLTGSIADFADTADLIDALDLVISVDTSTAHLAGAMGKPVWILNRFDTCWRWLLERDDSPWYPSARLFRQPALGAWEPVVERVRDALAHEVAAARGRASHV